MMEWRRIGVSSGLQKKQVLHNLLHSQLSPCYIFDDLLMSLVVPSVEIWNRAIYEWSLKDFTNIIWLLACADATFPGMSVTYFGLEFVWLKDYKDRAQNDMSNVKFCDETKTEQNSLQKFIQSNSCLVFSETNVEEQKYIPHGVMFVH